VSFDLDTNQGTLNLTFSEAVNVQTFNSSAITVQNARDGSFSYTLGTTSSFNSSSPRSISIQLSDDDLSGIKAARNTATSSSDTFISNTAEVVRDFSGTAAQETNSSSAIQATVVVPDTVNPEFLSFTFGALDGRVALSLTFSEVIGSRSVNASQLVLSSESNLTSPTAFQYQLATSVPIDLDSKVITIPLSDNGRNSDLFFLLDQSSNLGQVGLFQNTTYLYFPEGVASDAQGLPVAGLSLTNATQVTEEPGDLVPQQLLQFNLNMQRRTMVLVFSDEVVASTIDPTRIILLGGQTESSSNYTVTGGNVTQLDTTRYLLTLSDADFNGILAVESLITAMDTTYLSLIRGLARDESGLDILPISPSQALLSYNLTRDSRAPELVAFELSLSGTDPLILTFSETIYYRTFRIDSITLRGGRSSSARVFVFSDDTTILTTQNGPTIELQLTISDKAMLQQYPDIATTIDNTFMTITPLAVMDSDQNPVVEITVENAIQATRVVPDTLPPFISSFDINMDDGIIILTASEPIDAQFVNPSLFTLQTAETGPTVNYTLTSSVLNRISDFSMLTIGLSDQDLNELKAREICVVEPSCFLTYQDGAFADTFGEEAENISTGLSPTIFMQDSTSPLLRRFVEFNRATGQLSLTFSENVLIRSFRFDGIFLQSLTSDSPDLSAVRLTSGSLLTTENSQTISFTLSQQDMDSLRLNPFVCTSRGNCYVRMSSLAVTDARGNSLSPETVGRIVTTFVLDQVRPELANFSLNVNEATLVLTFSEPVSSESIQVSGITLQDGASSNISHTLSSSSTSSPDGREIAINLSPLDLNQLKYLGIGEDSSSTFLTIAGNATRDLALVPNRIAAIEDGQGLPVQAFVGDSEPPVVTQYNLDLDSNTLTLRVNEPIDEQSVMLEFINVTTADQVQGFSLTGGNLTTLSVADDVVLSIELTPQDAIALKSNVGLATDSVIRIGVGAISDVANNVQMLPTSLDAVSISGDVSPPRLESFSLNLQSNTLLLTFDDIVDPQLSFDPTGITLQGAPTRSSLGFYTLTSASTTNSSVGYIVNVNLNSDAQAIRENPFFGTTMANTYITIFASTIDTPDGEDNIPITNTKAMQASQVIFDSQRPELTSFDFNLNRGFLILTFSDVVDTRSFNVTEIMLQDGARSTTGRTYRLTNGSASLTSTVLTVVLSSEDLNGIKAVRGLATSETNTYITASENTIADLSMNLLVPVLDGNATRARDFMGDSVRPTLDSFILDRDSGVLTVTFSEVVDVLTLMPGEMRLQDRPNINTGVTTSLTLVNSLPVSTALSREISLRLPLSTIAMFTDTFGSNEGNTYLSLSVRTVSDLSNNAIQEVPETAARAAIEVIEEATPPALEYFDLDLSFSTLTLVWSKPVLSNTLSVTGITLQSAPNSPTTSVSLTVASSTSSPNGSVIIVDLDSSTTFTLRSNSFIANSEVDTYISLLSGVATGAFGSRPSVAIPATMARQARVFTADTVPPRVESFFLDLNSGELSITFDETISGFDPSRVQILDDSASPMSNYTLTDSSFVIDAGRDSVSITLSSDDFDAIVSDPTLASDATNTFLRLLNGSVSDAFSIAVEAPVTSMVVGNITRDSSSPQLLSFSLDLSREILTLNFSEVVDPSSIQLDRLSFQSDTSMDPVSSYTLSNSSFVAVAQGRSLELHLIGRDASAIKADSNLGTDSTNTFIVVEEGFISDFGQNSAETIPASSAFFATVVQPDTSDPTLRLFEVDLSNNAIVLTFSEAIDITMFTPENIRLSSYSNGTGVTLTLAGATFPMENNYIITLFPRAVDVTFLKEQSQMGTFASSVFNTYLSLLSSTARDTSGNFIVAIPEDMPEPANRIVPDTRGPRVVSFTLDMNNGNLTLQFDEVINLVSFTSTALTLQSSNSPTAASYSVASNLTPSLLNEGTVVMVNLGVDTDLNVIKGLEFCNTTQDCFLTHQSDLIQDELGNSAEARMVPNALPASSLGMDNNSPALVMYLLFDLNQGLFSLQFTETMYGASFRPQSFIFRSSSSSYTLTGGSVINSTSPVIFIQLSTSDLNNIKRDSRLCTNDGNCYPVFDSSFLTDFAGNLVQPYTASNFLRFPMSFSRDLVGPEIIRFELNLEASSVSLIFSEPVGVLRENLLVLQDAFNSSVQYQLTTSTAPVVRDTTATITLNDIDTNTLKATAGLAKIVNNTFLVYGSTVVLDVSGEDNPAMPRTDGINPLQAAFVFEDTTNPTLVRFSELNFNQLTLDLVFSEPVDPSSYIPGRFTFYSSSGSSSEVYPLTGGTASFNPDDPLFTTLRINLGSEDVLALQNNSDIATLRSNSYLQLATSAVSDFNENGVQATTRLLPSQFQSDASPARLVSFTLDMNAFILTLTFDDVVLTSHFDPTQITLRGDGDGTDSSSTYIITGGRTTSTDGYIISLPLTSTDVENIRLRSNLGTSQDNTYISVTNDIVRDFNGIGVISINIPALQATNFIKDSIPPVLYNFTLDVENGTMELFFSEIMEPDTFSPELFTVQSSSNSSATPLNVYSLTGGVVSRGTPNTVIAIQLSSRDVNTIKMQILLGTSETDTFLVVSDGAIRDTGNNSVILINSESALMVSLLRPDVGPRRALHQPFRANQRQWYCKQNQSA